MVAESTSMGRNMGGVAASLHQRFSLGLPFVVAQSEGRLDPQMAVDGHSTEGPNGRESAAVRRNNIRVSSMNPNIETSHANPRSIREELRAMGPVVNPFLGSVSPFQGMVRPLQYDQMHMHGSQMVGDGAHLSEFDNRPAAAGVHLLETLGRVTVDLGKFLGFSAILETRRNPIIPETMLVSFDLKEGNEPDGQLTKKEKIC
ncbi:hypothetical protein NE237_023744 [Protea cynaroides]|uniref:Uncharacterized protein n=1 Tax=Protea cynaroides TaxID=273540 RepID=A0A9Q0HFM7_9MAGN|nr:hypothetical protein NE237_023744 [Protea cynaroides]